MSSASHSLKRRLLAGTSWVFAGHGLSILLRFGSSLILTRLLFPEIYGVMAIVSSFLYAVNMLSDIGIGRAVIQSSKGNDCEFLNTTWCLQIVRGFLIFLVCVIAAWPMAILYDKPELISVIPALGLTGIFNGFQSTKTITLQRQIKLSRLTILDLTIQVINITVTIICAYIWPSIWALVAGPLVGELIRSGISHHLLPDYSNKLRFNRQYIREIFGFGRWVFVSSAFYFFSKQSDRFLLGYLAGLKFLGVYSVAAQIIDAVEGLITKLHHTIFYPALSQINVSEDRAKLRKVYYKLRLYHDLVGFSVLGGIASLSPTIIDFFYDDRYQQAGWIMQYLFCKLALFSLFTPCETCLIALGQAHYAGMRNGIKMFSVLLGMPIGWHYAELEGVLFALIIAELTAILCFWPAMARTRILTIRREFIPLIMFAIGGGCGYLVKLSLSSGLFNTFM